LTGSSTSFATKGSHQTSEYEAPPCAMISAITSDDSYLKAFRGEVMSKQAQEEANAVAPTRLMR